MASITKPVLLAVIGILAVVLILQGSSFLTGFQTVTTLLGSSNVAPWADTLAISASSITLSPCATVAGHTVTATLHDYNGYGNISGYTVTVYNANTSNGVCSADPRNCYVNSSCAVSNAAGTSEDITCTFGSLPHYAENGTWAVNVTVNDGEFYTWNSSYTDAQAGNKLSTVGALISLNAQDTINFGSVAPGSTSSAITNTVTNCGNWAIDDQVNATPMTCTVGVIGAGNISAGVSSAANNIPSMSGSLATLQTNTTYGSSGTPQPTTDTFWKISVPLTGSSGSCIGNVTFVAAADS